MADPPLYTASVPVLLRYLSSLSRIILAIDALPSDAADRVLSARLAPDMFTFHQQVETTAHFAKRIAFPLAGRQVPQFVAADRSCQALQRLVAETTALLRALEPGEFTNAEARSVTESAGSSKVNLPADRFLYEYAMPNFFFHLSMAYAIARAGGAAVGKGTYDGFHAYASGA